MWQIIGLFSLCSFCFIFGFFIAAALQTSNNVRRYQQINIQNYPSYRILIPDWVINHGINHIWEDLDEDEKNMLRMQYYQSLESRTEGAEDQFIQAVREYYGK